MLYDKYLESTAIPINQSSPPTYCTVPCSLHPEPDCQLLTAFQQAQLQHHQVGNIPKSLSKKRLITKILCILANIIPNIIPVF